MRWWSGRGRGRVATFFVSFQTHMWNNIKINLLYIQRSTLKHDISFNILGVNFFQCENTCFTIKPAHFPKQYKLFPDPKLFSGEAGFFLSNTPHIDSLCSNAGKKWRKGHGILASDINASSHIHGDLHTFVQRKWRFL